MNRRIQIVNEEDVVIKNKERSEIDYKTDIYRVAALWLTNSRGDVLLAQRKRTKDRDPGKWGPAVAGTLEEGETYKTNIYKEAKEEIGLTELQFELGPKQRIFHSLNFFCQWYKATVDKDIKDFTIQEEEVEEIAWVPQEELVINFKKHPEEYIATMPGLVRTFLET